MIKSTRYSDYENRWNALDHEETKTGQVILITTRAPSADMPKDRDKLKDPLHEQPTQVTFSVENGIEGDRWKAGKSVESQISLTSLTVCKLIGGARQRWHLFGNNFVVDLDLSQAALPVGTRLALGTGEIEISPEPHTPCDRYEARFGQAAFQWVGDEVHDKRYLRGRYARVIRGGSVEINDVIRIISVS